MEKEVTQLWRKTTDTKTTIPQRLLHALVPRHSRCAEWYGLPKDHKPLIPLRPIVSACDMPCERVSWLLERILHQLLHFVPAHLSNKENFLSRLRQVFPDGLPAESTLFTMDVTALYSNIPIEEGIQRALQLVEEHWDDIDTIRLELSELEDLRFVLTNSFFRFGGDIY